jgi:sulfotransferase family protein
MALEVIGAGFGRTGTMSLKVALEELGFGPCYHMSEVFENPGHRTSLSRVSTTPRPSER